MADRGEPEIEERQCGNPGRDRGEVASWLILLAGLCLAAVAAAGGMDAIIGKLTNNVATATQGVVPVGGGVDTDTDTDTITDGHADRAEAQRIAERQALFADDAYADDGGELPDGWTRINREDLPQELIDAGITEDHLHNWWQGYDAAIYQNENGDYVVSFRGTDGNGDHIQTNLPQNNGNETVAYTTAVDLVRRMKTVAPEGQLSVTGHSLGGGMASVAALANEVPATTYDPAGIHPNTLARHGADPALADQYITAYQVDGEILSNDAVPVWDPVRGWTRNEMQPPIGNIIRVPAIDADGQVLPPINDPGPLPANATRAERRQWNQDMEAFRDEATRRHGMDFVHRSVDVTEPGNE